MTMTHRAPIVNPTPADLDAADRLAWRNDSPDNDEADGYPGRGWDADEGPAADPIPAGYEPGWQDEAGESAPSVEVEYEDLGYQAGLAGDVPLFASVNPRHDGATRLRGEAPFYRGLLAGRQRHAFMAGHALGLAGQFRERPAAIHRRFDREFARGWQLGADAWADRKRIEAEWAAEYEADCRARMDEDHNREASGYYRAWGVAVD